jgi:putative ABC transport system permease protein
VSNVEKEIVAEDEKGRLLKTPVKVARGVIGPDSKIVPIPGDTRKEKEPPGTIRLASLECYMVMNQAVPVAAGEKPRRRFLQVRAVRSPAIAGEVHKMELHPGGKWFAEDGVHAESGGKLIPCVVGEGAAGTLGPDAGHARLQPGDIFNLGDRDWIVLGVLKSEGTTFGSEIWCSASNNPVLKAAGKDNKFTTLVLRMADNNEAASRAMAYHLQNRYDQAKLKAYSEPAYYAEMTKANEQLLSWIVFFAVVMSVGGVFGVMNTMFASIAARIKEVGVLRILGFKRWQILISFMLESLAIAFVGGFLGCALGYIANGFEASSNMSGGGGGAPKGVALKMVVDYQTMAAGMLFTLVMGRLGGLVPALSAMRMEILDSLK